MEFGVPSISAANPGDRLEAGEVTLRELRLTRSGMNPHLKWVDMRNHGYLRVELSHDKGEGVYVYVEKIRSRDSSSFEALRFTVPACDCDDHLYHEP
jgi:alkaline phosphatase D